jgi:transglutaminase-like putative cysteine protease
MRIARAVAAVLAAAALVPSGAAGSPAATSFTVAPPPAWVDQVDALEADGGAADARDGVLDLLEDSQIRVTQTSAERYYRHVAKVLTPAGLEQVSQLQFDFDPIDEVLVVHYVRIRRGAETIDALRPADVSVIQQENELHEQIYSGMLSAITFLRDVRPGDVVDYAYSLNRRGSSFGGRFADSFVLGEPYPVRRIRWRLLWPEGRPLWFLAQNTDVQPATRSLAGTTEYTWERRDASAVEDEDGAPPWFDPTPLVQVSEFEGWADVVRWALPYYGSAALPPEIAAQVDAWRAQHPRPEDRLLAAARFVQDEIRYTGIELGPSSYVPADPLTVFQRRFGDCKDKSLLLASMLEAMGIEARPALVNMDRGRLLPGWQPSPLDFDHVIVRASVGGKTYWVDSTITLQRGDLAQRHNPNYGYALVIAEGVTALEEIAGAAGDAPTTVVRQVYTLDGDGATLEVVSTYSGPDADAVRHDLAQSPLPELARDGVDYYGEHFPDVEAIGAPTVSDDQAANTIVVTERFRVPSFWEDGARTLTADHVEDALPATRGARRSAPLAVDHPVNVEQTIEVRMPGPVSLEEQSGAVEGEAVRFSYRFGASGNAAVLKFRYQTLRDSVPAGHAAQHRDAVKKIRKLVDYTLERDSLGAGMLSTSTLLASGAGLCLLLAFGLIVARRRSRHARGPAEASGAAIPAEE